MWGVCEIPRPDDRLLVEDPALFPADHVSHVWPQFTWGRFFKIMHLFETLFCEYANKCHRSPGGRITPVPL